jgi:hypothetical protein
MEGTRIPLDFSHCPGLRADQGIYLPAQGWMDETPRVAEGNEWTEADSEFGRKKVDSGTPSMYIPSTAGNRVLSLDFPTGLKRAARCAEVYLTFFLMSSHRKVKAP